MAQGIRWRVPFAAMDGTAYTINIYQEGFTGSPTTLNGAVNPFVTEEDNNEDLLTPVRTQTGYISIVTDRNTWLLVIKQGDYVTLTADGKTHWCGFVSKEAYNGDIFEPNIEYQIPVHCVLTHLKSFRFQVSPFDSPTFAKILHEGFGKFPMGYPMEMMWCQRIAGEVPTFLECRFQRSNFYDKEEDAAYGEDVESESTYFDVASEICKYFGITLCVQGEAILFRDAEGGNVYVASTQDLADIETDGASTVRITGEYDADNPSLTMLHFVSNANQESIMQPVRNVKVEGKINPYKDFDAQYPKEVIDKWINEHITRIDRSSFNRDYTLWTRLFTLPESQGEYMTRWRNYENEVVSLRVYETDEASAAFITSRDFCETSKEGEKIDYDFRNLLFVNAGISNEAKFGLYSKREVSLKAASGAINFEYSIATDASSPYGSGIYYPTATPAVWKLKIGDMYWNGSTWENQETTFSVAWKRPESGSNISKECASNRTLGDGYDGLRGLIIPISEDLTGKISLEFMGFSAAAFYFENITIRYAQKNATPTNVPIDTQKDIVMESSTGIDSIEDYQQSCSFATSPKVNGYGAVLDFNGIPLQAHEYNGRVITPEMNRLNTIKNWMNKPLSVLDIEIKDSDPLINRYEAVGESESWPEYSILSIGHDWRESKLKVKLIES